MSRLLATVVLLVVSRPGSAQWWVKRMQTNRTTLLFAVTMIGMLMTATTPVTLETVHAVPEIPQAGVGHWEFPPQLALWNWWVHGGVWGDAGILSASMTCTPAACSHEFHFQGTAGKADCYAAGGGYWGTLAADPSIGDPAAAPCEFSSLSIEMNLADGELAGPCRVEASANGQKPTGGTLGGDGLAEGVCIFKEL